MKIISIPDKSFSEISLSLSGRVYTFVFAYNELTQRYYLTIKLGDRILMAGRKLMEGVIINKHSYIPEFNHGVLVVAKLETTSEKAGRHNIGVNKPYQLVYIPN